jgi:hypothetical protein
VQLKPYVAYNSPKPAKVPPPSVNDLVFNLEASEVDVLDIVAPQHKRWREDKRRRMFNEIKDEEEKGEGDDEPLNVVVVNQ